MRTLTRRIDENRKRQLKETNFLKIVFDPKGSGCHSDRDTLVGYIDRNTMMVLGTQDEGNDYFELRMGANYTIGDGKNTSYSKRYDYDTLPPKWKESADELLKRREEGFDDLVAEALNEAGILGDHYFIFDTQWKRLKKMVKRLFDVLIVKNGDIEIIYDKTYKTIFAKYDTVDSEVWIDSRERTLDTIIIQKDDELLRREYMKSVTESLDDIIQSGDTVKITKGKYENEVGTLDLIMDDTYIVKMKNGTSVEIDKKDVQKFK